MEALRWGSRESPAAPYSWQDLATGSGRGTGWGPPPPSCPRPGSHLGRLSHPSWLPASRCLRDPPSQTASEIGVLLCSWGFPGSPPGAHNLGGSVSPGLGRNTIEPRQASPFQLRETLLGRLTRVRWAAGGWEESPGSAKSVCQTQGGPKSFSACPAIAGCAPPLLAAGVPEIPAPRGGWQ